MNKEPRKPPPRHRVDLHAHSLFSDGEDSPETVAQLASEAGLAAQALTDHDYIEGWEAFHSAANGFEPVCGVEISARYQDHDVHVLGLFVDPENRSLRDRLSEIARARQDRAKVMVQRLREHGLPLTQEQIQRKSARGTVGRPHVALALVETGVVDTVDEAFRLYLRRHRPGYVAKPGPSPKEAVDWIHEAGGVAVLAHPVLLRKTSWIEEFAVAGLDGIEVWHPKHNPRTQAAMLAAAERLDLVPAGGSDYHGPSVGDSQIGQEPVPLDILDRLRQRRP